MLFTKQTLGLCCLVLICGMSLGACGVGRAMIVKPPEAKVRVSTVQVSEGNSPVAVPDEVKAALVSKLDQYLYGEDGFQKGSELQISYRFILFEPGNQFTRWFWGGIGNAGEGSLMIETKYLDPNSKELATVNVEGRIGSGFFGGAFSEAVDKAAEKIAEYTKTNFR
jgi:hypothetical protein